MSDSQYNAAIHDSRPGHESELIDAEWKKEELHIDLLSSFNDDLQIDLEHDKRNKEENEGD